MVQLVFSHEGKTMKPELKEERNQMQELQQQLEQLRLQLQNKEQSALLDQFKILQQQNQALQEKYDFLVRKLLEREDRKSEQKSEHIPQRMMHIDALQLLTLLQKAGASNQMMSIQAKDLKIRFGIDCTEKTLRNKFNEMEIAGLVSYVGQKPKRYFITTEGMALLNKERQTMLQLGSIVSQ